MAETFLRPLPDVKRITLGAIDVLTEIELPSDTGKVSVQFITNPGKVAFTGEDEELIGSHYASVTNDAWFQINWSPLNLRNTGRTSVYLAGDVDDTVVEVLVED